MKNFIYLIPFFYIVCSLHSSSAQTYINSDQWAIEDGLGRRAIQQNQAKNKNKYVAMFYWIWHNGVDDTTYKVRNISKIIRQYPSAMNDYHHPAWGEKKPGYFYWEEPLLGYYKTTDSWVLRKHAEMLADAGVDVVFFDCTNGSRTWKESYEVLFKTWTQAQKDGVNVPKIAFLLPFNPSENSIISLRQLYNDVYKPKRYQNLWFYWKGKPCIMAYPDNLTNTDEDRKISSFFIFRPAQPDYIRGPQRKDQWGWLEVYPQHGYIPVKGGSFEQVTVGVAQNASDATKGHANAFNLPRTYGRSYSHKKGFDKQPNAYLYGWNFQEQWDRALELDPELVFVTGWNEYITGQWRPSESSWKGVPFSFVDEFDWDRSRDIEPNKGWKDNGDVYYTQLVNNIRKFKGINSLERPSTPKSINLKNFADWHDVKPQFKHYKGNVFHRKHRGRYSEFYVNNTGRNDIIESRVARDSDYIYFYVETSSDITPPTGNHWMMLMIDIDRNKNSGWNGYDFIVNRISPTNDRAILEKNTRNKWIWEKIDKIPIYIKNNKLTVKIPKTILKIKQDYINFEFKWNDNMQVPGDIMDFYVNGDTAPGGRFNFIYSTQN